MNHNSSVSQNTFKMLVAVERNEDSDFFFEFHF
jgi:hypothetical protein